jgi:hypothetical protein
MKTNDDLTWNFMGSYNCSIAIVCGLEGGTYYSWQNEAAESLHSF